MEKLKNLMDKWWFRLIILAGFAILYFILSFSLSPNNENAKYANDGVLTVLSALLVYPAIIVMYFTTDILDNLHLQIGKFVRKVLLLVSLGVFFLTLALVGFTYLFAVNDGKIMQPFYDGIGLAPFMTYAFLYFFVVRKFEVIDKNKTPDRLYQFILIILGCLAPAIIGMLFIWILSSINDATVTFIALLAFMALIVLPFVFSIRKYGLFLGGLKEYERDKPVYTPSSSSNSTSGEWENKFVSKIESYAYGTYTTVTCRAFLYNGVMEVNATIDFYGTNNVSIRAQRINEIKNDIQRAYKEVAKNCPYSSKLFIEVK